MGFFKNLFNKSNNIADSSTIAEEEKNIIEKMLIIQ